MTSATLNLNLAPRASRLWLSLVIVFLTMGAGLAQEKTAASDKPIKVDPLPAASVPNASARVPLSGRERLNRYLRETYLTPPIYLESVFASILDQAHGTPKRWGGGMEAYGKRLGTRHAQFVLEKSFSAAGSAALGWESGYDACRCRGFWSRTRHAAVRNFVTYGRTGKELRPNLAPYAAAFGARAITATWNPDHPDPLVKGYQGAIAHVGFGIAMNWLREFSPEVKRLFHKKKNAPAPVPTS